MEDRQTPRWRGTFWHHVMTDLGRHNPNAPKMLPPLPTFGRLADRAGPYNMLIRPRRGDGRTLGVKPSLLHTNAPG